MDVITYNDIMLTQHWHLPKALVGESVKVIRSVLPPRPALGPSSLDKLIWHADRSHRLETGWLAGGDRWVTYLGAQVFSRWTEKGAATEWRQKLKETASGRPPPSLIPDSHWTFQLLVKITLTCPDQQQQKENRVRVASFRRNNWTSISDHSRGLTLTHTGICLDQLMPVHRFSPILHDQKNPSTTQSLSPATSPDTTKLRCLSGDDSVTLTD